MKPFNGAGVRPRAETLSLAIAEALRSVASTGRAARGGFRPAVFAASGGAILASALAVVPVTPASAQEDEAAIEEITVTGSRIRRQDFTANSPIQTVDEQVFDETTSIGVNTILNQLPQFVPAVTQFTTTDVQQTATNTVGASTVSLRGLGPNRNLVLINGRRAMPVNATMVVDTNSIPSAAIARVEVISGGASAVYGADAVGGVVNFILKDDFEGAAVDVRFGDTQHGGNQEITVSGLIGANMAGDRGNVMIGVERASRSLQHQWQRDWRVDDMRKPNTPGTAFGWGTDTWVSNLFTEPQGGPDANIVSQDAVDDLFDQLAPGTISNNPGGVRYLINRDSGTIYTGLMQTSGAPGSYRYEGPLNDDFDGNFPGLPFRVFQPNGNIKENTLWQWASSPLERLSAFANGHFDVADNIRVTAQAMVSRTHTKSSLGLSADNITLWGAPIPFGNEVYRGNPDFDVPDSLNADGTTNQGFTGRFDVVCDGAPTAEMPWLDGLPGCTESEAWPTTPEVYNLFMTRADPEMDLWAHRPPDYLRDAIGAARSSTNTLTTMNFSMGVEGEMPSGNDFWDITVSTGRTDNYIIQRGSSRITSYRGIMSFPNFGRNALFDPNPVSDSGFAESIPTCQTGLPIFEDFDVSKDCATMLSPDLKNQNEVTQTILEANLVGDLIEIPAGPLQYALGLSYRENSYEFIPDNLSDNQNFVDPIAGLFPNEASGGDFDVSEIYGELLIPIVSDGPTGVEHFIVELGGRVSDWSMPQVDKVNTYKALIDWAVTPRYRLRGGFNRALRAPNLGELFIGRTQIFGGGGSQWGDHCSQNLGGTANPNPSPFGATPGPGVSAEQVAQTLNICRTLMGAGGAFEYYDNQPVLDQPEGGGLGIRNSFGNPNLMEEQADTFTLGVVMDFLQNWTLTADYYSIEIDDMIALESGDATYQRCLDIGFNPTGDPNAPACSQIFRNPTTGGAATIDSSFTNQGRAEVSGVDLQLNYSRMLGGGGFNASLVANYNLGSETQDRPELESIDWAGTTGCALQIQCQGYDYRIFSTFNYFRGPWSVSLRHQFWPEIESSACLGNRESTGCRFGGVQENFSLFALSGRYSFRDNYTLVVGIENLFDTEPPCNGGNPEASPFPTSCTRGGGGATYDPLGRRGYLSLSMQF